MVHYKCFHLIRFVQARDWPTERLGLCGIAIWVLNGAYLGDLFDFEVSRSLLEVVPIKT